MKKSNNFLKKMNYTTLQDILYSMCTNNLSCNNEGNTRYNSSPKASLSDSETALFSHRSTLLRLPAEMPCF